MFLSFWEEYYEFFIILIGIIIGMVVTYIIFFRPKNAHDNHKKSNDDLTEETKEDTDEVSFEVSDVDIDDEYLSTIDQEEFVLGENSNILESLDITEEETKEEEEIKKKKTEENFDIDDIIYNKRKESLDKDSFDILKPLNEDTKNTEEKLNKIVREVIPLNDYANKNIGKYHVLFRKDDKRWYVKREGKDEIDKFLATQHEAIAFATIQALIYDTTVVVHDEDGKISKYDF